MGRRNLFIQTPPFIAIGPCQSQFKEDVRQLPIPLTALGEVLKVDQYVNDRVRLPANAPPDWLERVRAEGDEQANFYRCIDVAKEAHFVNIMPGAPVFDVNHQPMADDTELAPGEYRAMLHVRGIYFSTHGNVTEVS